MCRSAVVMSSSWSEHSDQFRFSLVPNECGCRAPNVAFTYSVSGSPKEYRICFFLGDSFTSYFRIQHIIFFDGGYMLMCQSITSLTNFTHFLREEGLCPSPPAVTAQWLFRWKSTGCLDILIMMNSCDTVSLYVVLVLHCRRARNFAEFDRYPALLFRAT